MIDAYLIKGKAHALGFDRVGIVEAMPSPRLDAYLDWIGAGYHAGMGYMARPDRVARRRDLNVILPGVQTLVCAAMHYPGPPEAPPDPARGRISCYARGADYHAVMLDRLEQLAEAIPAAEVRAYVDTGPLLERDHAYRAGLGFTGKNTMLIAPQGGSYFFLGELLIAERATEYDHPSGPASMCGTCTRCQTACPTAAFPRPYVLDAGRCISYLTIEHKGPIPRDLRPLMGNWLYGCDVCQEVCPFNRFADRAERPDDPSLIDILTLSADAFADTWAHSEHFRRLGYERLLRNACIVAGNSEDAALIPTLIPALKALLRSDSALIRLHTVWALGRLGAESALVAHKMRESDPQIQAEMRFFV
jgi:epoxyqueuosine reductase